MALSATAAAAQSDPAELFDQGIAAFEAGLYDVAARNFRSLVNSASGAREVIPASFLEALSLFYGASTGDAEAAHASYRLAAERFAAHQRRFPESPYYDQIWYWIGTAELAAGDAAAAVLALQRHVDQPSDPPPPYLRAARETQARAQEQLGRPHEARAVYEALLAEPPDPADQDAPARWLERLGMLLLAEGRYPAAADRFERILADYPHTAQAPEALFFIAEANHFGADTAAAEAGYRRYLELFPEAEYRHAAGFRLARLLLNAGELAAARQFAAGLAVDSGEWPSFEDVALLRGDLHVAAGEWAQAVEAYEAGLAVATTPELRQVLNLNLGLAHAQSGAPLQAMVSFDEAALGPDGTAAEAALYNRALLLLGEEWLEDAAVALAEFLERFPDSGHREAVEALLMEVQERSGDQAALLDTLERVAARRRLTPEEEQRRGIALLVMGEDVTALEMLTRSAAELPAAARAESQYRIGAVYARRGEFARSVPFFRTAVEEPGAGPELRQRAGYALGVSHFNNGEYEAALALLEEVTANSRGSWLAAGHFAQAATLYRMDRAAEAARHFGLAAATYASREVEGELMTGATEGSAALARTWQALALFRSGDLETARALFRELAADHEAGSYWYRAGLASALLDENASAEDEFHAALQAVATGDPLRPAIYFELARLHRTTGNLSAAEGWLQRLAEDSPGHRLAAIGRLQLADALRADGQLRAAVAEYRASIAAVAAGRDEQGPQVAELARYAMLLVSTELEDTAALAEAAWSYLMHHPDGARVEQVAALLRAALVGAGEDAALTYYHRARPADAEASIPAAAADTVRLAYAETLIASDSVRAEQILREVVDTAGSEASRIAALLLIGRTYEAAADWPRAISLYRGLALAEDAATAGAGALGVARALAGSGDLAAAAEEYGAVAIRFADDPEVAGEAWLRGVEVLRTAGAEEQAAEYLSRLLERYPDSQWAKRAAQSP